MRRARPLLLLLATCATASCAANAPTPSRESQPAPEPSSQPTPSSESQPAPDTTTTDYDAWGRETIALPPSFAPEMTLVGEETLRFAPGMFKAEAADFFSYAFVLDYPETASISTANVVTLIEQYYRGLMTAVATDKNLDTQQAQTVDVTITQESATRLVLSLQVFDAFVTAAPLALQMRIERQSVGSGSCLLAQVAPNAAAPPVWQQLAGAAQQLSCLGRDP